ncbi:hypothetical protein CRENBAI_005545 [Crenichthys baileyi]|uniref:Uncharacterized protein n=1 Tax=Crenichthys baileyi TaxID=28760 RepID=A0AAV9RE47_9TELE
MADDVGWPGGVQQCVNGSIFSKQVVQQWSEKPLDRLVPVQMLSKPTLGRYWTMSATEHLKGEPATVGALFPGLKGCLSVFQTETHHTSQYFYSSHGISTEGIATLRDTGQTQSKASGDRACARVCGQFS